MVKDDTVETAYAYEQDAQHHANVFGLTVIPCRLVPVDDLERLVRAAKSIASEIDTPVSVHSSEAIAEFDKALEPFGDIQ